MAAYEIVAVAFMIAQKDVFAVYAAIVPPPTSCLLDSLAFGVAVVGERDIMSSQEGQNRLFSCHFRIVFESQIFVTLKEKVMGLLPSMVYFCIGPGPHEALPRPRNSAASWR